MPGLLSNDKCICVKRKREFSFGSGNTLHTFVKLLIGLAACLGWGVWLHLNKVTVIAGILNQQLCHYSSVSFHCQAFPRPCPLCSWVVTSPRASLQVQDAVFFCGASPIICKHSVCTAACVMMSEYFQALLKQTVFQFMVTDKSVKAAL